MELYKLIATINNGTPSTFTLEYLPENFEGIKISQKFSFQNPIGYTPKFSVDTMRIIKGDKTAIDTVFDEFGLESDVQIEIKKLKAVGFGYDSLSAFAIDFESYEKFDSYSEFALKSISVIDDYNRIKSAEMQIQMVDFNSFDYPVKFTNKGSLIANTNRDIDLGSLSVVFRFSQNGENVINNRDSYLYPNDSIIYKFGANALANPFYFTSHGTVTILTTGNMASAKLVVCKNGISTEKYTIVQQTGINSNSVTLTLPGSFTIPSSSYNINDELFIAVKLTAQSGHTITGVSVIYSMFFDFIKQTDTRVIDSAFDVLNIKVNKVLQFIFNNKSVSSLSDDLAFTGANAIYNNSQSIVFKPTELFGDLCRSLGLSANFKNDGTVKIDSISDFFGLLLDIDNAIEVDAQDISVKYGSSFNYTNVTVGREAIEYDVKPYLIDWTKVLGFEQSDRKVGDELNLTISKLRTDATGYVEAIYKRYTPKNDKSIFLIDRNFPHRTASTGELVFDIVTPRDILENWRTFLSFAFQNFGKDTITISSNGGTDTNLEISGVKQMDDIVFAETPRLLPIEYNFTCLLDSVDFSEKILKINHNGETVYLFVFEAETTDKLSEQKIKALKIQF